MGGMAAGASLQRLLWVDIEAYPSEGTHTAAWDRVRDADNTLAADDIVAARGGRGHCSVVGMGDGSGLLCTPFHVVAADSGSGHSEYSSSQGSTGEGSPSTSRRTCETRLPF